ncbi:MAG TPA: radical SAM family heme chaperone HemW [Steroidobacteraceae bacterium]|nr:radical SAM family heme chaperone HemW [Steroidobacteraceae bacterium]
MPVLLAPPLSLYVHFPWCVRKCPYCDFNSYTLQGELAAQPYVARLARDLEALSSEVAGREVATVFFGGGTPSLFSPDSIAAVLAAARRHLLLAADAEVTLEANPGAVERGAFAEYRAAGVTRVSLGAQSFAPEALTALGRIHSPGETRRAAEELHAAGLDNFNLDLMYALPGQSRSFAVQDIAEALALSPAHVSHYQLTLEPGTVFAARPPPLPDEDEAAAMLEDCGARLAAAGFARYEVSAYARPGRQCRHNLNYWRFGDYLGVGAGAHGKITLPRRAAIVRTMQPREPRRYLSAAAGELTRRTVPSSDLPFEFMLNALRLTAGFTIREFTERTGLQPEALAGPLGRLRARGLIEDTPEGSRASDLGMRFLNDLLLEFMPESPEMSGAFALSIGPNGRQRQRPRPLFTGADGANGE